MQEHNLEMKERTQEDELKNWKKQVSSQEEHLGREIKSEPAQQTRRKSMATRAADSDAISTEDGRSLVTAVAELQGMCRKLQDAEDKRMRGEATFIRDVQRQVSSAMTADIVMAYTVMAGELGHDCRYGHGLYSYGR